MPIVGSSDSMDLVSVRHTSVRVALEERGGKEGYDGTHRKPKGSKYLLCHK